MPDDVLTRPTADDAAPSVAAPRWPLFVSCALAMLLFVLAFRLLHVIGGTGGIASGVAVTCAVTWWFVHRRRHTLRQQAWTAARSMTAMLIVWSFVSFTAYVMKDNGETVEDRVSAWGRNHGMGYLIDRLEQWVYSDPPAKEPAKHLVLAAPVATTTPPTMQQLAPVSTVPPPAAPPPITPVLSAPLPGEGQWSPVALAGGEVAMWATSVRPLEDYGSVLASAVVIDQRHLRVGMFNGAELPGGSWVRDDHVPIEMYPALVAVMNGGFRLDQSEGGYMTEGRTVQELIPGRATLAIDKHGSITVGKYGRDMVDDGTWLTLRQNLVLLLDQGVPGLDNAKQQHVFWGAELDGTMYVNRSAACIRTDGRFQYVMAGKVDAAQFARVLLTLGCWTAIQLDVNGAWPTFLLWEHASDGSLIAHRLDQRMNISPLRYTQGSSKEFFAFFDATLVPFVSVLDT